MPLPHVVDGLFAAYKKACVKSARLIRPDEEWETALDEYLADPEVGASDKEWIAAGRSRNPRYYEGGKVLKLQPAAGAMTLDDCVFVRPGEWTAGIYVHEMVHVGQYGRMGPARFLAAYFGSSAVEITRRLVGGRPVAVMTSSRLESDAYRIGNRFAAYYRKGR